MPAPAGADESSPRFVPIAVLRNGQAPENTMNILVQQSTAALGHKHKEVRAAARSKMSITPFGVAEQSFAGPAASVTAMPRMRADRVAMSPRPPPASW
jgi:hypothetical protein